MAFKLTTKQQEAQNVLASNATHVMLFGGSRSGKTFLLVRNVIMRALKAPGSRHAIIRFRFNAVVNSVVMDTFPKAMQIAFPGVPYRIDKQSWFAEIEVEGQKSQIWFAGLDDGPRIEKILGMEFATIYLNESSQIAWNSVGVVKTRLAQKVMQRIDGQDRGYLKPRFYFDCNPPNKAHWTYIAFIKRLDPETKEPLRDTQDWAYFQINPQDNAENLSDGYLDTLQSLSARLRKRFLSGEFADATPNQLFSDEVIDRWRHLDGALPDFVRVVVAVDPSGSGDVDNADNDEIGIMVVGLGTDGNAYLLQDCTVKAGPATWGAVATSAYDRHAADVVVGEVNYGGAMVEHVIRTARPRTPFKMVTATRGKAVRAEPFSALYEQGKVRHVGEYRDLEDELTAFSTAGYTGERSPNRADALIWALTELFPGMVRDKSKKQHENLDTGVKPRKALAVRPAPGSWMSR
jgi:phage terminase large subunit-like protein